MNARLRNWLGRAALLAAIALLLLSIAQPYWRVHVVAPQYPQGLQMIAYANRVAGDIQELDILNHYIGMRPLLKAAQLEQRIALPSLAGICALLLIAGFMPRRWALLLALPAVLYPFIYAGDLYWWMRDYGLNLDPRAPLRIKPFVPPLWGTGQIAQFQAAGQFQTGYWLAVAAAVLSALGVALRPRRAKQTATLGVVAQTVALAILLTGTSNAATLVVAPDASLAGALHSAQPGDTIIVRGGAHRGPVAVDKTVALLGENAAALDGGGQGTVLTLNATGIVVRGFTIRNSGDTLSQEHAGILVTAPGALIESNRLDDVLFGVYLRGASQSVLRGNTFRGKHLPVPRRGDLIKVWHSDNVCIEGNRISGGRDTVLWYSKRLTVTNNDIGAGRYGLHFMYCNDATVENNRLSGNSVGAYLMYSGALRLRRNWIANNRGPSGYGVGLKDMEGALIADNVIADNRAGLFVDGALHSAFDGNLIAYNDLGVFLVPSSYDNDVRGNSFVENGEQVSLESATSPTANRWRGNFWSDYAGYDADGDGTGDTPYRAVRLFEQLAEQQPGLRLFAGGPSAQALDFAARMLPIFEPQPRLTDSAPRMRAALPGIEMPAQRAGWLWWPASALLCGVAALLQSAGPSSRKDTRRITETPLQQTVLSVRNLTKRFGSTTAVDAVSFEVTGGETIALWGANGAGKTTILRCLLGVFPFDGEATALGLDVRAAGKTVRRLIGYVPQEVRLHGDLTGRETLRFYAALRKVAPARAEQLLAEWRLADLADKPVRALSGGMKQRLAVAIALLSDPPVLLLDEPTSNLDRQSRAELWSLLRRLKAAGKTLIVSLHRAEEVLQLADRVIVLEHGRKIAEGAPAEIGDALPPITLRVAVPAQAAEAAALLSRQGFDVQANGAQLWVRVPLRRKSEPLAALFAARIAVTDFELMEREESDE